MASLPVVLLVLAVATDRFGIRFRGVNVRLELLAAMLLVIYVLARERLAPLRRLGLIEFCLAGWLAVGALSSAIFSPAPADSLRLTLLLAGLLALYGVAFALIRTPQAISRVAEIWVAVGGIVAAIGLIDAVLYILFSWRGGISFEGAAFNGVAEITPKVHATMWEPNIFGSYLLTVWAMALGLSLASGRRDPRRGWLTLAFVLSGTGIMLSSTRALWVLAPLLMLAACLVALRLKIIQIRPLLALVVNPTLLGLAIGLATLLLMSDAVCPLPAAPASPAASPAQTAPPPASAGTPGESTNPLAGPGCVRGGSAFFSHARGLVAPGSQSSFLGRWEIARLALRGWLQHPIFGRGSGSYLFVFGPAGGGWIGNLELHILFDTGVVGFLFLATVAAATGRMALNALTHPVAAWTTAHFVVFGALTGAAGLLAAYQLTEGTWLGFTWVFLAIFVAAARFASAAGLERHG